MFPLSKILAACTNQCSIFNVRTLQKELRNDKINLMSLRSLATVYLMVSLSVIEEKKYV